MDRYLVEHIEQLGDSNGHRTAAMVLAQTTALRAVAHLATPVGGRSVLDLECGDGKLTRWLAVHGAGVTGVDGSVEAIEAARQRESRESHGISYLVGDPEDLYMIEDSAFNEVVCNLSLARMESLAAVIAEVARIITLGGRFVFSIGHPCFELELLGSTEDTKGKDEYFAEGIRDSLGDSIQHRTLATYINAVAARGFTVRRVLEKPADKKDVLDRPEFESWLRKPVVLVVEAVFPYI